MLIFYVPVPPTCWSSWFDFSNSIGKTNFHILNSQFYTIIITLNHLLPHRWAERVWDRVWQWVGRNYCPRVWWVGCSRSVNLRRDVLRPDRLRSVSPSGTWRKPRRQATGTRHRVLGSSSRREKLKEKNNSPTNITPHPQTMKPRLSDFVLLLLLHKMKLELGRRVLTRLDGRGRKRIISHCHNLPLPLPSISFIPSRWWWWWWWLCKTIHRRSRRLARNEFQSKKKSLPVWEKERGRFY